MDVYMTSALKLGIFCCGSFLSGVLISSLLPEIISTESTPSKTISSSDNFLHSDQLLTKRIEELEKENRILTDALETKYAVSTDFQLAENENTHKKPLNTKSVPSVLPEDVKSLIKAERNASNFSQWVRVN